jgi:hypothetical protein
LLACGRDILHSTCVHTNVFISTAVQIQTIRSAFVKLF